LRLPEVLRLGFRTITEIGAVGASPEVDAVGVFLEAAALGFARKGQATQSGEQGVAGAGL
jgi:hypothetical protein